MKNLILVLSLLLPAIAISAVPARSLFIGKVTRIEKGFVTIQTKTGAVNIPKVSNPKLGAEIREVVSLSDLKRLNFAKK